MSSEPYAQTDSKTVRHPNVAASVPNRPPALAFMEELDHIADAYELRHGTRAVHVSHWDPSPTMQSALGASGVTPVSGIHDTGAPRYSRKPHRSSEVLRKLGITSADSSLLVTENGTTAVAAIANHLSLRGVSRVLLLDPYFFSTPYTIERLGLPVQLVPIEFDRGRALLPDIPLRTGDALWITNPVFSTGLHDFELQVHDLVRTANDGIVIVSDEVFASPPTPIAAALGGHPNFVGMYSPHKPIGVNRLKFCAIVFNKAHAAAFDDWADILCGGLSGSAIAAIDHYLSSDFDTYQDLFYRYVDEARDWHDGVVARFKDTMRTDATTKGSFLCAYAANLPQALGEDLGFLARLTEASGCIVIPGGRGVDHGFHFRVNLARDCDRFRHGIVALYEFLSHASFRYRPH